MVLSFHNDFALETACGGRREPQALLPNVMVPDSLNPEGAPDSIGESAGDGGAGNARGAEMEMGRGPQLLAVLKGLKNEAFGLLTNATLTPVKAW